MTSVNGMRIEANQISRYNVEDNLDVPAHRHFAFKGIEKTDELLTGKRGSEAL